MKDDKDDDKVASMEAHLMKKLDGTSYIKLLEEAEALRVRMMNNDRTLIISDVMRLATLSKYLSNKGHTEAIKLSYKFLYYRFFKDRGL